MNRCHILQFFINLALVGRRATVVTRTTGRVGRWYGPFCPNLTEMLYGRLFFNLHRIATPAISDTAKIKSFAGDCEPM